MDDDESFSRPNDAYTYEPTLAMTLPPTLTMTLRPTPSPTVPIPANTTADNISDSSVAFPVVELAWLFFVFLFCINWCVSIYRQHSNDDLVQTRDVMSERRRQQQQQHEETLPGLLPASYTQYHPRAQYQPASYTQYGQPLPASSTQYGQHLPASSTQYGRFLAAFHFQTVLADRNNITAASIRSIEENKEVIDEDPPLKANETDRESSSIRSSDRKSSTIRWTNFLSSWRKPAKEDVCPICLDEYHPGERICTSKTTACSHVFHLEFWRRRRLRRN